MQRLLFYIAKLALTLIFVFSTSCADDPVSALEVDSSSEEPHRSASAVTDFYRKHRYDALSGLPVDTTSIVFAGNSITHGNEWWECFDDPRVVNRGVWGTKTAETLYCIENILTGRPDKLVLLIGTNDIGIGLPVDTIVQNISLIMQRTALESPRTKLYVTSIFPSTEGTRTIDGIAEVNARLKEECERHGATYIDLFDDMMGITNRTLSAEGLHLNAYAYSLWCERMASVLGLQNHLTDVLPYENFANNALVSMRGQLTGSLTNCTADVLLLGGEMWSGSEWHELMGSTHIRSRAFGVSLGGMSYRNVSNMAEDLMARGRVTPPRTIMLYYGDKELINNSIEPEALVDTCLTLLDKLAEVYPRTTLVQLTVLPHRNVAISERIQQFNARLIKELPLHGYWVADVYSPLALSNGTPKWPMMDNEYLMRAGYSLVAEVLSAYVYDATPLRGDRSADYAGTATARNAVAMKLNHILPLYDRVTSPPARTHFHKMLLNATEALRRGEDVTAKQLSQAETKLQELATMLTEWLDSDEAGGNQIYWGVNDSLNFVNIQLPSLPADTIISPDE